MSPESDAPEIGQRLRRARHGQGSTLRDVATAAGLSESFLSQLERGKASASLATLQRLTAALGLSMSDLFDADPAQHGRVLAKADRPRLAFGDKAAKHLLTPQSSSQIDVFIAELQPGGSTGDHPYAHPGSEELVLVLAGVVQAQVGAEVFDLTIGDSISYASAEPHRMSNPHDEVAELLWIASLPDHIDLAAEAPEANGRDVHAPESQRSPTSRPAEH